MNETESGNRQAVLASFWIALARGIVGGAIGGTLGFFIFQWMASQGFYSGLLPGALMGIGFGSAARRRSTVFGIICGVLGLLLGCWSEWMVFWKPSFLEFMSKLNQIGTFELIMIGLGGLMAFWFGRGR